MIPYSKFSPTPLDPAGAFLPDRQDWLVAPVSHNRDSGPLSESNWDYLTSGLSELDPFGNAHEIHLFNHWACGWFEIVIVRPSSPCEKFCQDVEERLSDYPVLDEEDYSMREWEEAQEAWANLSLPERVEVCSKQGVSIFAARRNSIPQDMSDFSDFYISYD